jgi:Flp pilus assembly protein TadD
VSDDVLDLLRTGDALVAVKRFDQALDIANQAVSMNPDDSRAHTLRTCALVGLNRRADAESSARKVVSLAPDSAASYTLLCETLINSFSGRDPGTRLHAVTAGREAVRLDPLSPGAWVALAGAAADPAYMGDADRAVRQAIQLRPNSPQVWVTASYVALNGKSWRAAERAARKALALDPDNYAAANNLGEAMRHRGRFRMGGVALYDAAGMDPRSPEARSNLESLGFQYMASLMMIPALLVPAIIGNVLIGWLVKQPEHFRPVARRLGIRLATSPRYQRKFAAQTRRKQKELEAMDASSWSATKGRQGVNWIHGTVIAVRVAVLVLFLVGWASDPGATLAAVAACIAVFFLVAGGMWIAASVLARRDGY